MVGGLLERNLQVHLPLTIFPSQKHEPFYSLFFDNLSQYVKSNLVPGEIVSVCCYFEILRRNHAGFRSIAVLEVLKSYIGVIISGTADSFGVCVGSGTTPRADYYFVEEPMVLQVRPA